MTLMKIKEGDVVEYEGRTFDVVKYDGLNTSKKGKLKIMERASMFDGAVDAFLDELPKEQVAKLKVIQQ